jgi:hypothetical protein
MRNLIRRSLVLVAMIALAAAAVVPSADAAVVTYSTEMSFDGGPFSTNATLMLPGDAGTMTLTFNGVSNVSAALETISSLGTLVTGGFSWFSALDGHTFDLKIIQSAPTAGTGDSTGTLSGGVSWTGSFATATFDTTVVIDGVTYQMVSNPVAIFAPAGSPGNPSNDVAMINAHLTNNPEPGTLLLVGTGIAGLGGVIRRRLASKKLVG